MTVWPFLLEEIQTRESAEPEKRKAAQGSLYSLFGEVLNQNEYVTSLLLICSYYRKNDESL
ncbi:MAG: hypothetical protein D3908_15945 [Candidatus Electrothrix sp. AUS4]|nr:hypothetical protein [Candidatus Electrothrix sp. AUS4]